MKDTDYAYAVARIRANERYLLSKSDIERLISSKKLSEALGVLKERGWSTDGEKGEIENAIRGQQKALWALLCECVPDRRQLSVLVVQNDFFNLKAALKCMITGKDAEPFFAYPTTLDLENLVSAFKSHNFEALGGDMRAAAESAYNTACRTENGQSADIIIDKAALKIFLSLSRESGCELLESAAKYITACADIKIAYRASKAQKGLSFIQSALSGESDIDFEGLSRSAAKGTAALLEFLQKTPYSKESELLSKSSAAFEKGVDDAVTELMKKAKYVFFGFEPVAAYYYAKTAELKTVRAVLCAKQANIGEESIRERVRTLYV